MATQPVISPSSPDQTAVSTPTVTAEPERIETPVSAQDPSAVSFSLPTKSSTTPAAPSRDDPRFSFASTRYSTTSSIFSVRPISTASTALTRGSSVRQSSLDSEPFSAISPWENEQRKDSFDASHRYFCTSCNSTFDSKGAWKEHQVASHGASHPCYPCGIRFEDGRSLVEHLSITHSFPPLDSDGFRPRLSLTSVKRWGCGFCDTSPLSLPSHSDYLDHVGTHMDEGRERVQWQRQTVIKALLQTPVLKEAWQGVVKRQEVVRGSKLRFSWDDQTCLLLQRLLECFDGDNNSAEQLAETVLRAAEVKVAENIKGTYTTDGLSSHIPSSLAAHSGPVKQTGADVPATPENPDNGQPSVTSTPRIARPPSPSPRIVGPSVPPFGSFLSHVAVGPEHFATLSPRVLAKIQETLPAQQSPPTQPDPRRLQPAPVARHPARQGTLRRIESDWDLGLSRLSQIRENEPTVPRPQTSLAFRPIQNPVLDIPEDNGSHLGQPSPQTPGDRSPTSHAPSEEWLIPSIGYPRGPPSGSSLLSIHTMDHSRSIETSDCETISEPESWLDLNERPDLRLCVKEYYRRVGRVMGHLWVCYNRDWDALITQCVGEQSSSNYAPSRESRGQTGSANTQLSTYSLQPHRLPAGDREDDDEMDELRPNSSQSKRGSGSLKRFACPFRKRFPTIYSHSVPEHEICALRSWDSVSRMKEHLYRKHCKIHCPRCKRTFRKQDDLQNHEMDPKGCQVRDIKTPADITAQQEKQLKSKKYVTKRLSEEDKWRDIYRLLFPGERVPSPYPEVAPDLPASPESRNNLNFQHFLLQQMPQIFRQTAATHYAQPLADHVILTVEGIDQIITESINKAFEEWQAIDGAVPRNFTPSSIVHDSMATSLSPSLPIVTPEPTPNLTCNEPGMFQNFQPPPPELNNYSGWQGLDNMTNAFPDMPLIAPFGEAGFLDASFDAMVPPFDLTELQPNYNVPGNLNEQRFF